MKYAHGWTLIELLITLTIICIIVGLGIPSFNKSIKARHEQSVFKTLQHLSTYARTEAIRRNNYYTLCPSRDQFQCGGSWNHSIIIFSDHNKNELIDGRDVLYRTYTFDKRIACIRWNLPQRQYLQFKPSGAVNGTAGHFSFCDTVNRSMQKKVVVSFNGRVSIKKK